MRPRARRPRFRLVAILLGVGGVCGAVRPQAAHASPGEPDAVDADGDGLADSLEQRLAERFAPVVYHSSDESNFPTSVDDFLAHTALEFSDDACGLEVLLEQSPTENDLPAHAFVGGCGRPLPASSGGTRSRGKHRTFFLADLPARFRSGTDTRRWTTYVHAYPNDRHGVTLQYWRFYAFNDAFNNHGGDWEGLHIVLDASERPVRVRLLEHSGISELEPSAFTWEGTHIRVFAEGGGHATRASGEAIEAQGCDRYPCWVDPARPSTFIRNETWTGGVVRWPNGTTTSSGALIDMGERQHPHDGQEFVRYSGIWGSPGVFRWTSGYWGPAFNETAMRSDGFVTAWCAGIAKPTRAECFIDEEAP